ncbi:very-long-chain 3-oxoacyl-CoA reductase-like isoform X2 [Salvelinus fontinalis]|uniref:very-long-chain 3-oxoacyl-CoA reductase-like isoform X2 n=1 Tax=Salvelinus fontinalis TaxID=8038 RepID=UPI0024863FA6|nr:very-long-chain 3-oxoacyl-CoA reductase-like isoform X2 [Salvelinus fontinalis]
MDNGQLSQGLPQGLAKLTQMSRSKDKLHIVAKEIESQHGRQTQIIQTDFTEGHDIYPAIAEALRDLDIGILVNNVGMNYSDRLVHFLDIPNPEQIFVTYFSRSLNSEYKSQGITVQCVAPFMVSTNMTHNLPPNLLLKSASAFAREALNTVGHSSYTSGCVSHALQHIALSIFFPDWLRLSSYCVKQTETFAKNMEKKIDEMTERSASKED